MTLVTDIKEIHDREEYNERYAIIKKTLVTYEVGIRQNKENGSNSSNTIFSAMLIIGIIICIIMVFAVTRTTGGHLGTMKQWIFTFCFFLTCVSLTIIKSMKNPEKQSEKTIMLHTKWLRPKIMPILYPGFLYEYKSSKEIIEHLQLCFQECSVLIFGHLENDYLEIYEIESKKETGESIFHGLAIFIDYSQVNRERFLEKLFFIKEYEVIERDRYDIILIKAAGLDIECDIQSIEEGMAKDKLEKNYFIINSLEKVLEHSS